MLGDCAFLSGLAWIAVAGGVDLTFGLSVQHRVAIRLLSVLEHRAPYTCMKRRISAEARREVSGNSDSTIDPSTRYGIQ